MRLTATGLAAAALLGLTGSMAHADPFYGCSPQGCVPRNPIFYNAGNCGCWYGPNYCFQGPCLPGQPFGGVLPLPKENGKGLPPGHAPGGGMGGMPGQPGIPGQPGFTGYYPPPPVAVFPSHQFARSPRDFFMYGQEYND